MTVENITTLAYMKLTFPESLCYMDVLVHLSLEQKIMVSEKAKKIQEKQEQKRLNSLTNEEQRKIEESLNDTSNVFRGNLFQQELDSIYLSKIEKEKEDGS